MNTVSRGRYVPGRIETLHFVKPLYPGTVTFDVLLPYADYIIHEESYTPNSSGSRHAWKEFQHRKAFRAPNQPMQAGLVRAEKTDYFPQFHQADGLYPRFAVGGYTNSGAFVSPFGEPGLPLAGLPSWNASDASDGFVPKPVLLGQLNQKAYDAMLPKIKSDLSLVNSLIELKDFKTIGRSFITIKKSLSNFTAIFAAARRRYASLRAILKGPADGYLQAKFNLLPLLSDISGIHAAITQFERRLNDFVTRAGRVQCRHFTYNWNEYTNSFDWEISEAFWPVPITSVQNQVIQYYLRRQVVYSPSIFHAQIEYNYNFTQYQLEHARVLALLDYLGVNLNPAIIWNAIPWSFVVDWVFSIGKWLDHMKTANMQPRINILRYLWSVKRERSVFVEQKGFSIPFVHGELLNWEQTVPLPTVKETAYRRGFESVTESSIQSSGLNPTEFSLGAALVIAQSKHHKYHRSR